VCTHRYLYRCMCLCGCGGGGFDDTRETFVGCGCIHRYMYRCMDLYLCLFARRTPRPCSVCGSPRFCRRCERRLIGARFGRWREERFGRARCLTLRYSLLLSVWVDPSAEHNGGTSSVWTQMDSAAGAALAAYTYIGIDVYIYTYVRIYLSIYLSIYIDVCVSVYICTYTHTYIPAHPLYGLRLTRLRAPRSLHT